ncbi:MAG TPA: hypothetical protein VHM19_12540 [Polyangiales bacterium]|jgi:hypothetical protein|nr:hypothetical protein [Polyangiales bacterium]
MSVRLLIVERPGAFRDALGQAASAQGASVQTHDDAMSALGALDGGGAAPSIVLVSEDPGPPGAGSLCRVLRRRLAEASVVRLGDPAERDPIDAQSPRLPRALGAQAVVRTLLAGKVESSAVASLPAPASVAFDLQLGANELPALLVALAEHWLSGVLLLGSGDSARELSFVRGLPVWSRSSLLRERLGSVIARAGLASSPEIEAALDAARVSGERLGEALLARGTLDGKALFSALSAQLIEQLVGACAESSCRARFVLGPPPLSCTLRLHPLTALLAAAEALSGGEVTEALQANAERSLPASNLPRSIARFLQDLGVSEPAALLDGVRVSELSARLRDAAKVDARAADNLALVLARATQRSFDLALPSAIAPLGSERERVHDDYLHGSRSSEVLRELALHGPAAEASAAHAELLALFARAGSGDADALFSSDARGSANDLRFEALALRKRVDTLAQSLGDPLAQHAALAVREHLERALARLPSVDAEAESEPVLRMPSSVPPPRIVSLAPQPSAARAAALSKPPPPPPVVRASLPPRAKDQSLAGLPDVDALIEQGKWHELRALLETKAPEPAQLPPTLALLYSIAVKEDAASEDTTQTRRVDVDLLGIRAMADLLGISEQSPSALLLAKRMLRRRPLEWNQKPPRRISFLVVAIALLVGIGAGFFISPTLMQHLWK